MLCYLNKHNYFTGKHSIHFTELLTDKICLLVGDSKEYYNFIENRNTKLKDLENKSYIQKKKILAKKNSWFIWISVRIFPQRRSRGTRFDYHEILLILNLIVRKLLILESNVLSSIEHTNDEQKSLDVIIEGLKYNLKINTIIKDNLEQT